MILDLFFFKFIKTEFITVRCNLLLCYHTRHMCTQSRSNSSQVQFFNMLQLSSSSSPLLLLLLSPLCRVFTLIYLKQTMFLGYTLSQLFCVYCVFCAYNTVFNLTLFCASTLALSEVCLLCPIWLFSVVP
jgi:hypothetical protein